MAGSPLEEELKKLERALREGARVYVDAIEGELPPEEVEKLRRMLRGA